MEASVTATEPIWRLYQQLGLEVPTLPPDISIGEERWILGNRIARHLLGNNKPESYDLYGHRDRPRYLRFRKKAVELLLDLYDPDEVDWPPGMVRSFTFKNALAQRENVGRPTTREIDKTTRRSLNYDTFQRKFYPSERGFWPEVPDVWIGADVARWRR